MRDEKESLIVLGVVVRPHGVHGDLVVKLFNPDSDLIFGQSQVILRKAESEKKAQIEFVHPHREGIVIISINGCYSRIDADAWRGFSVCMARSALPELGPDEYYHADLVGLEVVTPKGDLVGKVEEVVAYPTADALLVHSDKGSIEIPIIDPYVLKMDFDAGRVIVDHFDDFEWEPHKPKKKR
jgi:16S rRNA processing protein RimM